LEALEDERESAAVPIVAWVFFNPEIYTTRRPPE
jgi:hypothetical protein